MACGFDAGTYNLVCCKRDEKNNFVYKREVNAFIEFPIKDRFVFNMMKNAVDEQGNPCVPLIEWKDAGVAYALGEAAMKLAYSMPNLEVKRPMSNGCLNPKEKHAQQIMAIMAHSLIDESKDKEDLYYSVPANAVNQETDSDYHSLVLKSMFDAFKDEKGNTVVASPINEALALVYAELQNKMYTGISASFGAGMVNICYAMFGTPVFSFSVVNSGDWIDQQSAKATGESIAVINKEKMSVDLTKDGNSLIQNTIKLQYELMIQKAVSGIKKAFDELGTKVRSESALDVVVAGGTSSPNGFDKLFEKHLKSVKLPVEIDKVIKPADPLFAVARGCLLAAEASQ
jgi:hypothetical protein